MTSRFLGIKAQVSLETLREPADLGGNNIWNTIRPVKTFDMAGANYPPLPNIAKERSNRM